MPLPSPNGRIRNGAYRGFQDHFAGHFVARFAAGRGEAGKASREKAKYGGETRLRIGSGRREGYDCEETGSESHRSEENRSRCCARKGRVARSQQYAPNSNHSDSKTGIHGSRLAKPWATCCAACAGTMACTVPACSSAAIHSHQGTTAAEGRPVVARSGEKACK